MQQDSFVFDEAEKAALEALPVPLGVYHARDGLYRMVLVSDGLCKLCGIERSKLMLDFNNDHGCFIHPEDRELLAADEAYAYLHPEEGFKGTYRINLRNHWSWLSADGKSRQLADHSWLFYVTYADVSNLHEIHSEQASALQRTNSLMQKILSTTKTSIFWKDANRRFLGANQAFLDYYGFKTVQDILGKTDEDMGWHTDPDPYRNDEIRILQTGTSTVRVRGKCMAHGEQRDIVASKSPLYEDGKIVGLVGSFEDVTEEYGQRARANYLRSILDNIPSGVCVYHEEKGIFRCIAVNRFMLNILEVEADELLGRSLAEREGFYHPSDWPKVREDAACFRREQPIQQGNYRMRKQQTGTYVWFHLVGYYVQQEDGSAFIYVSYTDISDAKRAEKEVLVGRQIYESAADAAGLVVWQYDIRRHRINFMANDATELVRRKLGLPEIIEYVPDSLLGPVEKSDRPAFLEMYRAIAQGKSVSNEIRFRNQDNTLRYERINYSVVLDDDGVPMLAYGIGRNITQEKQQELQYKRMLMQLNNVTGSNVIAKGHYDLTANRIIDYSGNNSKAISVPSGSSYNDYIKQLASLAVELADQKKIRQLLARYTLIEKHQSGEQHFSMEYYRRNDGMPPILVQTDVSTFSVQQDCVECFIITYDMTKLLMERSIISKIADFGYEYIGIIDGVEKRLTFYTPETGIVESTAENPLVYDEELCSRVLHLVPDEQRENVKKSLHLQHILQELETQPVFEYTYDCVEPGNTKNLLRKRVQFCYLTPARRNIFFARSDITQQYQRDMEQMQQLHQAVMRAEKANEARSMFLSSVSHDMRTPLNGIIGFTNFAMQTDEPGRKQEYLKKIKLSSSLLLNLINDTLELSRIESGKVEMKASVVNSSELLESIVVGVRVMAADKNVDFTAAFGSDFPEYVCVDELKLQEICLNLLSNAIKFTPSGGHVRFTVYWILPTVDGMNCKITVQDNGIGISREFMSRMFEPFSQEHAPESQNAMGTGLGLSIVKRYVSFLGGRIEAQSERGRGTVFTIYLPIEAAEEIESENSQGHSENIAGMRVLLFEDNYLNREIATMLLKEKGVIVTTANDGREGLNAFKKSSPNSFDAILMDLRMPIMDGYEATKAIRRLARPDAQLPIIAMTADAYEEDVKRCTEAGMNGYVVKPVDPARLYAELGKWYKV